MVLCMSDCCNVRMRDNLNLQIPDYRQGAFDILDDDAISNICDW